MPKPAKSLLQRIDKLKQHLQTESPLLVEVVGYFQDLDQVGYRTGLLDRDESFANTISWWPLVSVLGTFSAGKSTFVNNYLGVDLQQTGNQAVDDKFTVLTYSADDEPRVLPGLSLDADPRFPFYQISEEIEKVSSGEGGKIDNYLQLKTCHSDKLKGVIMIDSPGFDADEQRNTILKITDHIVDLSDLVLVFFDARHPEPRAMQDTLEHLVKHAIDRSDATKFVFILNQIDTSAREDNLDDVVAAWQKSIVQTGMTAGTFYRSFNASAAVNIDDPVVKERYQRIREHDLGEITSRIEKVGVERSYRIVGSLENTANLIEQRWMPRVEALLKQWRKAVLISDAVVFGAIAIAIIFAFIFWDVLSSASLGAIAAGSGFAVILAGVAIVVLFGAALWLHYRIRRWQAGRIISQLKSADESPFVIKAFRKNTGPFHSVLRTKPMGWGGIARKKLVSLRETADRLIQTLNDRFTDPSGGAAAQSAVAKTDPASAQESQQTEGKENPPETAKS